MPQRNKFYQPASNGCGSLGLSINTEYLPAAEMETCCHAHDVCYDTCNKDKELCDLDFKRCLYNYCDSYEKSAVGPLVVKGCKAAAKMLFTGTITLGCRSYLDSQERSCYCHTQQTNGDNQNRNFKKKTKYSTSENTNNNGNGQNRQKPSNYGWKDPGEM